jgi:hypothetical protein
MVMRILQISSLLVLGLVASSSPVDARSMWDGPCSGRYCTSCSAPQPSGQYCWVGGDDGCQDFGCSALYACGPDLEYAQCECDPCD